MQTGRGLLSLPRPFDPFIQNLKNRRDIKHDKRDGAPVSLAPRLPLTSFLGVQCLRNKSSAQLLSTFLIDFQSNLMQLRTSIIREASAYLAFAIQFSKY